MLKSTPSVVEVKAKETKKISKILFARVLLLVTPGTNMESQVTPLQTTTTLLKIRTTGTETGSTSTETGSTQSNSQGSDSSKFDNSAKSSHGE